MLYVKFEVCHVGKYLLSTTKETEIRLLDVEGSEDYEGILIKQFYTVYGKKPEGTSQAITDYKTKDTADELCEYLNGLIEIKKQGMSDEKIKYTHREIVEQAILRWQVTVEYIESMLGTADDKEMGGHIDGAKDIKELNDYIDAGEIILEDFDKEDI